MATKKLIDKLLEGAEDVVKAAKKPFIKKRISRAFESALDSAEEKQTDAELKIHDLREKLVKEPEKAGEILNDILGQRNNIEKAEKSISYIKKEKGEWFD